MARLSLFKPGKSKDYRFLDRIIAQCFDISGTLIYVHRYIGPSSKSNPDGSDTSTGLDELTIQDVLLIENRDRNYDSTIIDLKGNYTVNDLDFNLTAFGIIQNAGALFINFHINQMVERLGRKLIPGDVLEIVHRRDELLLDTSIPFIPAFYVVKDTAKAADGYSPTWLPHIWRIKAEPITDSQEYKQIFDAVIGKNGQTVEDLISTGNISEAINDAIRAEGEGDVETRNFNSDHLFIYPSDQTIPGSNLLKWQFNNDGAPPNMDDLAPSGTRFPENPEPGDYFIRTDYSPPRMFERTDSGWKAIQDIWRDRPWSPAHRSLEDHLEDQGITEMSTNPDDHFTERQPISKVIPSKDELPKSPDELLPGEE